MNEKAYFDTDGNKRSLNWMTRNEPEWAANVIRSLEEKNCSVKQVVAELVDLMERSDMEEFGNDCQPVTSGEWFPAIARAKAAIEANKELKMPEKQQNTKCTAPVETYSRVVGFFRPVQHWNKGKQQEFADRQTYDVDK